MGLQAERAGIESSKTRMRAADRRGLIVQIPLLFGWRRHRILNCLGGTQASGQNVRQEYGGSAEQAKRGLLEILACRHCNSVTAKGFGLHETLFTW